MQRAASEPPRTAFMASISAPSMPMPHQQSVPLPHMMAYPTMFFVPVVPQPYVDVYQGKRPVTDIQALKHAIISAQATPAGTPLQHGDVWRLLSNVSFTIGERGFTNMIQSLGKAKDWRKALEVFEFVRQQAPWALNTYTYTTAIAACGISGRCNEAEDLFHLMREASKTNNNCAPNTITYSALISAYSRDEHGTSIDKVMALYEEMATAHLQPDAITFSALISACERAGAPLHAVRILDEAHERGFVLQTPVYNSVLAALASQGFSERATEVFLGMQVVGIEPNRGTYAALMAAYKHDGRWAAAIDLLSDMERGQVRPDADLYALAVEAAADADEVEAAFEVVERMQTEGVQLPGLGAASLVAACNRVGGQAARLRALGLMPPLESPGSPVASEHDDVCQKLARVAVGDREGGGE